MRDIRPIRNEDDLAWALAEVEKYFDDEPEVGSEEGDRFDVLSDLIEAYESKHHPITPSEPISFLKNFMEMTGRTQADFGNLLGSRSRASEILNRKRPLTVDQIALLAGEWRIPVELLITPVQRAA
jgi:HTH-type transcriptional regulator / antitoxin HigA